VKDGSGIPPVAVVAAVDDADDEFCRGGGGGELDEVDDAFVLVVVDGFEGPAFGPEKEVLLLVGLFGPTLLPLFIPTALICVLLKFPLL